MVGGSGQRTWVSGSVAPVLARESSRSFLGSTNATRDDCTNVSPPQRGDAVPAPLSRSVPKWQDNYSEGSDHPVAPNRHNRVVAHSLVEWLSYAAFTLNGFDDQEQNLSFMKTDFQISCLQWEAIFLSFTQTKYCVALTTRKYFYTSFRFGIWLSNLHV